jgi:hypothetical protein
MKHAKMLAIAAVAVFCVSAFAIAINVDNSSAEGEKQTYSFYLELRDGESKYSTRLADVTVDGAEPTGELYKSALTTAATAAGLTITFSGNMVISIVTADHTYASGGSWGGDDYIDYAVYYYDGEWKASNLADKTMLIIVFDKYLFSEPSDPSKYLRQQMGEYPPYWTALPTVEMVEYKIYYQCNDGEHSFKKWTSSTQPGISGNSLKSARILGAKAAGFEVVNGKYASGMTSVTADGFTYAEHGTYKGEDYYNFAAYCKNGDKNEWKDLQGDDLTTATIIAEVFDLYKFTDPQDSSYYHHEAVGQMEEYWTKSVNVLPDGSEPSKKSNDNLVLYIVIGVVAVVAVAAIVFFILKKKA